MCCDTYSDWVAEVQINTLRLHILDINWYISHIPTADCDIVYLVSWEHSSFRFRLLPNAGINAFEFLTSWHFKYPTLTLMFIFLDGIICVVLYVLLVVRPIYIHQVLNYFSFFCNYYHYHHFHLFIIWNHIFINFYVFSSLRSKVNERSHYLKLPHRSSMSVDNLLHY